MLRRTSDEFLDNTGRLLSEAGMRRGETAMADKGWRWEAGY